MKKKTEILSRIERLEKLVFDKTEPNKELEIGKWYKCKGESKFLAIHLLKNRYGFDCEGEWFSEYSDDFLVYHKDYTEATPQEVEKVLIEEAKRRYKVGDVVESEWISKFPYNGTIENEEFEFYEKSNVLYLNNYCVFNNGKWADVIKNDDKPKRGDVCKFWDEDESEFIIDVLNSTDCTSHPYNTRNGLSSINAKKLTEQEVIDLLFRK